MDDEAAAGEVRSRYVRFAEVEADHRSPLYAEWARGLAADDEVLALIAGLSPIKQQPNLVFASFRFVGAPLAAWHVAREVVLARQDEVVRCIRSQSTQTNEARRQAVLLPAFASLPQPLALVEVGASMGLCLQPGRWSYEYETRTGSFVLGEPDAPRLRSRYLGDRPATTMPQIAWSGGLDLNPLSALSEADAHWLETLIWPVGDPATIDRDRVDRLRAAVAISREYGPEVLSGDLVVDTASMIDTARKHAETVVVFHTAVLAYVPGEGRARFAEQLRASHATWISNEGLGVLPRVREQLDTLPLTPQRSDFCIAINEHPFALADAHGSWVRPLSRSRVG